MRILLIRHGQTPANVQGILETSHPGPGLTDLGQEQAAALPSVLAGERIRGIYVSTLLRTQLTATPLATELGLEPVVEEGLHEIEAGSLEGLRDRASVMAYLGTLHEWGLGRLGTPMPGGPDGHDFFARYDGALDRIAARHDADDTVVAVSHGAAIRVWCGGTARNIDPSYAERHDLENTGIIVVEGSREAGFDVVTWMGEPVGGFALSDPTAVDPAGESF